MKRCPREVSRFYNLQGSYAYSKTNYECYVARQKLQTIFFIPLYANIFPPYFSIGIKVGATRRFLLFGSSSDEGVSTASLVSSRFNGIPEGVSGGVTVGAEPVDDIDGCRAEPL
jgi:hypothetical protein